MRILPILALALAAACAANGAGAGGLAREWTLAEVNGRALPAPSPTEVGVTVERGSLRLEDASHQYTLSLTARTGQPPAQALSTAAREGTWRARADTLWLGDEMRALYSIDGAGLTLRLQDGGVYRFVRR